jgi:TRAP-type C4-dicarboxylate transport system permease small subunit
MKQIFSKAAGLFESEPKTPNPDLGYNIRLLEETKTNIETGIFTRYFKKPVFVLMELVGYSLVLLLTILGGWFCYKLTSLFGILNDVTSIANQLNDNHWDTSNLYIVETCVYILSFLPAIIALLWTRGYTKARQKINVLMAVEENIERVIFNLKSA